jgi:hypothetical protein
MTFIDLSSPSLSLNSFFPTGVQDESPCLPCLEADCECYGLPPSLCSSSPSSSSSSSSSIALEVGMRLEAVDIQTTGYVCVATIAEIDNDNVKIHFDGWGDKWDYWCHKHHSNLAAIGSCEKLGLRLQPPRGLNFPNWEGYLDEIGAKCVPLEFFGGREFRFPSNDNWVVNTKVGTWTSPEYEAHRLSLYSLSLSFVQSF